MKKLAVIALLGLLAACGNGESGLDTLPGVDISYDGNIEPDSVVPDGVVPDSGIDIPVRPDTGECEIWTSGYGFTDLCDGTVRDTNTGLIWEKGYGEPDGLLPNNVKKYCNLLKLGYNGGNLYEDWRAPTIDELRTLIVGCPKTELGGTCPILHECADEDCLGDDPAFISGCYCGNGNGPVSFPEDIKCYLDSTFETWCQFYYSQTLAPKEFNHPDRMIYVSFNDGKVDTVPPGEANASAWVKCVRGQSSPHIPCVTTTTDNTPGCTLE